MPKFSYQAINENGSVLTGVIEADSVNAASLALAARGYIPSAVVAADKVLSGPGWTGFKSRFVPVGAQDLILFTKQFRTMIRAGVPMLDLLQVLETQAESINFKRILACIHEDLKEGASLHEVFGKHPRVFSPLYCSMLQAGETTGSLVEVLERLIYILEHEHKIKSEIKAALQYPVIVVIALGIAFFVLLTFVIPKFVQIFMSAGLVLPLPTRICMLLYRFLADYWYVVIGALSAGGGGLHFYFKTDPGRYVRDQVLIKIPILGALFVKAAMSRFASIFSILQTSGVPVMNAMQILSETIGNIAISREFDRIKDQLIEGRGIADPLRSAKFFTPMVISMIAIGEDTGNLDELLKEVSVHYDAEVEFAMKRLSDAIGPLLTVGLAVVVGFFALAIFLPMWDLTKMVR